MTVFVLASLAIVLVLVALALRPLWTGARRSALALALALGVGTAGLYALLGTPDALDPAQVKAPETLEEAIVQLERRLADEPGSVEGWVLLGRSHAAQGNWTGATDAFGKAQALLPEEPDLMVELADARMRAATDGRFPADAVALLERAVQLRPDHQRALFYLGAQQLQAGRPAEAADTWGRLLPLVDASTARVELRLRSEHDGGAPAAAPGRCAVRGDSPVAGRCQCGPLSVAAAPLAVVAAAVCPSVMAFCRDLASQFTSVVGVLAGTLWQFCGAGLVTPYWC